MIADNTAKAAAYYAGDGKYMTMNLYELLHEKPAKVEKTGQEIVADITRRMGLEVINDGII